MVEACPGQRTAPTLQGGAANAPGEGQEEPLNPSTAVSEVSPGHCSIPTLLRWQWAAQLGAGSEPEGHTQ